MGGGYGMAAFGRCLGLAVSAALLVACRCAAQAQAPSGGGGGNGCMPELVSLSPCMGYMSAGNATAPGAPCCSALSRMLGSSPGCLCTVLGSNAATLGIGIAVDGDSVLRLPMACRVQTPSASQCDSMESPLPSDPSITPAWTGSKATPTPQYSGGNASKAGKLLLSAFIAIVGASFFIHGV